MPEKTVEDIDPVQVNTAREEITTLNHNVDALDKDIDESNTDRFVGKRDALLDSVVDVEIMRGKKEQDMLKNDHTASNLPGSSTGGRVCFMAGQVAHSSIESREGATKEGE